VEIPKVSQRISASLKKTIEIQSVEKSTRRLENRSRRDKMASCVISNEVSQKLYEDAKRRQSQKLVNIKKSKKRERSNSMQTNPKSKKYLIKRFIHDFDCALRLQGLTEGMVNYFNAGEILKCMGFTTSKDNIESNEERILFIDMWRCLRGDDNEGVHSNNLKMFLGGIEGFTFQNSIDEQNNQQYEIIGKISSNQNTPSGSKKAITSSNSAKRRKELSFPIIDPVFDRNNIIQLSQSDIKAIQNYYFVLARNRSSYLSTKFHQKHVEHIEEMVKINHNPTIDERSRKIIKDLHEKLNENQIPHYEFLLFKGREYERKIRETKTQDENKQYGQCTFFPDTSVTSSFYNKNKDKFTDNSVIVSSQRRPKTDSTMKHSSQSHTGGTSDRIPTRSTNVSKAKVGPKNFSIYSNNQNRLLKSKRESDAPVVKRSDNEIKTLIDNQNTRAGSSFAKLQTNNDSKV